MILSLVSELLARVGRRPVVEEAVDTLRRSGGFVRLDGLTDPAKTLVATLAATELGRPAIFIVESNQRAEALVEPLRWFYRAITGKPGHRVVHLPCARSAALRWPLAARRNFRRSRRRALAIC